MLNMPKVERSEVQRNRCYSPRSTRGPPKMSDCTPICGGSSAIIGVPSAASTSFLLDVRRFCCSLPAYFRYVDKRTSIRPGQRGAAFFGFVVFGLVRAACSLSLHRAAAKQFAPRAFPISALRELAVEPSPLRHYASSLRPEASMLSSSASAPSCVSSFANT